MRGLCPSCGGSGQRGKRVCASCLGVGYFPVLASQRRRIREMLFVRGGRRLRRGRPLRPGVGEEPQENLARVRAYYVWRLARFHGGIDVRMPIMAEIGSEHDPQRSDLEEWAEQIARDEYGTDMAAARIWGRVLGAAS